MRVSFVIPNYNGEQILQRNLSKVLAVAKEYASKERQVELIVVDDASTDASLDVLRSFAKKREKDVSIKILTQETNRGFSSAVNRGVREAVGELAILLNTDAYPEEKKEFVKKIVRHFSDASLFAVGCMDKSIEPDGSTILRGRGVGVWREGFLLHKRGEIDRPSTLWVSGGSSAFRRSVWEELGGMHEIYNPFYWEDIDLSYRAVKAGHSIVFAPECLVVHEHEKGAIKSSSSRFSVAVTATRNQLFFTWINLTDISLVLLHLLWIPLHLLKAVFRLDRVFIFGFIKAAARMPETLSYRRRVRKLFQKKDAAVVAPFAQEMQNPSA